MKQKQIEQQNRKVREIMQNRQHEIGPEFFNEVRINSKISHITSLMHKYNISFSELNGDEQRLEVPLQKYSLQFGSFDNSVMMQNQFVNQPNDRMGS